MKSGTNAVAELRPERPASDSITPISRTAVKRRGEFQPRPQPQFPALKSKSMPF